MEQGNDHTKIAVMAANIEHIKISLNDIKRDLQSMEDRFVLRAEFNTIRSIVYGMVAVILLAVLGALLDSIGIRR